MHIASKQVEATYGTFDICLRQGLGRDDQVPAGLRKAH